MKPIKCPNCGAPLKGLACAYCGQTFAKEALYPPAEETPPVDETASEIRVIRPKRTVLDKILIAIGILWMIPVIAAAIELRYYHPVELAAVLLLACPGIVLLLIGLRKKKTTIIRGRFDKNRVRKK